MSVQSLFSARRVSGEKNRRQGGVRMKSRWNTGDQREVSTSPPYYCTNTTTPSFTLCQGFSFLVPVDFRFSNFASCSVTAARFWINWPVVGCRFCFRSACRKYVTAWGGGGFWRKARWPTYIFARVLQGTYKVRYREIYQRPKPVIMLSRRLRWKFAHVYQHPSKCTDKHTSLQSPRVCALVSALEQAGQGGWLNVAGCVSCKQCATHFPLCVHGSGKFPFFFRALLTPKGNLVQEPSLCCCPLSTRLHSVRRH